jgi:hypothetical protein
MPGEWRAIRKALTFPSTLPSPPKRRKSTAEALSSAPINIALAIW